MSKQTSGNRWGWKAYYENIVRVGYLIATNISIHFYANKLFILHQTFNQSMVP